MHALELAVGLTMGICAGVNPDKTGDLAQAAGAAATERQRAPRTAGPARFVERYVLNPQMRLGLALGLAPHAFCLLETTGRRSGKRRRTPVGNGLIGTTFWLVSEHGSRAGYVRNIEANPRVRVKVGRTWLQGTAHILPDDDPFARVDRVASQLGRMRRLDAVIFRFFVSRLGTRPLTVRIDLDPPAYA